MKYTKLKGNLFDVPSDFTLAHCIDETAAMGAGIASQFAAKYPEMHKSLKKSKLGTGGCVLFEYDNKHSVANLVTKPHYSMNSKSDSLPSTFSVSACLQSLWLQAMHLNNRKIAMPLIGCGLDRFKWPSIRNLIKESFRTGGEFEIIVCYLEKDKYKLK